MILGVVGVITVLCITEYYIPDYISNIPYLGDVINNIMNLFSGSDSQPPSTPESISRSSSSGSSSSTITLRDLRSNSNWRITPPNSRPTTPLHTLEDSNVEDWA
jgi:hypothetical protein